MSMHHRCKTAAQRKALRGTETVPVWTFPQAQVLTALAESDLVLFDGGNGGGKSWLLAQIVAACLKGAPWARAFCASQPWITVTGVTFPQMRDTIYRYLNALLPKWMRHTVGAYSEGVPAYIQLCNGSRVIFLTGKQDVDAHAGRRLDLAVYDEHPVKEHLHEGFWRMPLEDGRTLRILIGMTPTKGKSWVYEEIVRRAEEIGARVVTSSLFENGTPPCQTCHQTREEWDRTLAVRGWQRRTDQTEAACTRCATYGVEPRVKAGFVQKIRQRFRDYPKECRARLYGTWEDLEGERCLTEAEAAVMETGLREPESQVGGAAIFAPAKAERQYVSGVDTSKGNEGDETVFQFLDLNGQQVVCWADRRTPPTLYVQDLIELSQTYGRAKACVESLDVGYFVLQGLQQAGIPCYTERNPLKRHGWKGPTPRAFMLGLNPSARTRDRILVQLVEDCRASITWRCACHAQTECVEGRMPTVGSLTPGKGLIIRDRKTWEQVTRLRRNPDRQNRIDVTTGEDDRALGLALANECRRSLGWWEEPAEDPPPLIPGIHPADFLRRDEGRDIFGAPLAPSFLQSLADEG